MPWRRTILASKPDVLHIQNVPQSHYDIINEGPISTVSRTWTKIEDGEPLWVVVKSATTYRKFGKEPHDIVKELRILSELSYINVIQVIGSFHDEDEAILNIYMPYIPISLRDLLCSPFFSPHSFPPLLLPDAETCILEDEQFTILAKSIMAQSLCAIAYLHNNGRIAHRDIKPENLLLTRDGCVKLIDFGTVWKDAELDEAKTWDLWPEYRGGLYFEVSTGAYRAPELLFGVRNYDPLAIDLWSLGATFAEFFTTMRLVSDDEEEEEEDEEEKTAAEKAAPLPPFVIPRYLRIGYPGTQWRRDTLYNGDRGEIGLAWSIFKIHGTPTPENWPEFNELPGAKSVVFNQVPAVPLQPLLPNLPRSSRSPNASPSSVVSPSSSIASPSSSSSHHTPTLPRSTSSSFPAPQKPDSPALSLLSQFLVYPASKRLRARTALRHAWFTRADGVGLLLPPGYPMDAFLAEAYSPELESDPSQAEAHWSPYEFERGRQRLQDARVVNWRGKTLKECLEGVLVKIPGS